MNEVESGRTAKGSSALKALETFFSTPLDALLERHRSADPGQAALALFHRVAAEVPAYKVFLAEHGVNQATVITVEDFKKLPHITKQNYIRSRPLAELCRGGQLSDCDMVAVSSGSTGKPTFWPRFVTDELSIAARFEQVLHDSFRADTRRTLAVVCFALGTWVGGMYTAGACRHVAAKGYPVTVITPGNNKDEILRVVEELGPSFEQVILLGYPPFLKDVVDTGISRGVVWSKYSIKLVMAGEVFSEEWRSLMGERTGATSPLDHSASLYGTADAGVLGNETPLSIAIRRFLAGRPDAARALFGQERLPTLVQYDPMSRFFESLDGALCFSGDNGIPLVRYDMLDTGGVIPFDTMERFLAEQGFTLPSELSGEGARGVRRLPFVYVFGRSDFTVSFFGANVYPENVTVGLEQPIITEWVTGKFVLQVKEDTDINRYLSIVVELAPGVSSAEEKRQAVAHSILEHLLRLNSEFANYVPAERRAPAVELVPFGDPAYFPAGVKHRYTRR